MRRLLAVAAALVLGLTGCQTGRVMSPAGPAQARTDETARMRQQAVDALARWDAAYAAAKQPVFAPLSDFEPTVVGLGPAENEKDILYGTSVVADGPLSPDTPGGTELRWASGATRPVTVLTAGATFAAIVDRLRRTAAAARRPGRPASPGPGRPRSPSTRWTVR